MKIALRAVFGVFIYMASVSLYADQYGKCGNDITSVNMACDKETLLYIVPQGAMYAERMGNPGDLAAHLCPNKPYPLMSAEIIGASSRPKEIKKGRNCTQLKRVTAKAWVGDPLCLDPDFEEDSKPDWDGEFFVCDTNVLIQVGSKYLFIYSNLGENFFELEDGLDENRAEPQNVGGIIGFVSFMVSSVADVSSVVKIIRSQRENIAILNEALEYMPSRGVSVSCQVRPHSYENDEGFDAYVSVTAMYSGKVTEVISLNIVEGVSHGKARSALDISHCKEITFIGY